MKWEGVECTRGLMICTARVQTTQNQRVSMAAGNMICDYLPNRKLNLCACLHTCILYHTLAMCIEMLCFYARNEHKRGACVQLLTVRRPFRPDRIPVYLWNAIKRLSIKFVRLWIWSEPANERDRSLEM